MNWRPLFERVSPEVEHLAFEAARAIISGDHELAIRRAEEAARRQAARLAVDAALKIDKAVK